MAKRAFRDDSTSITSDENYRAESDTLRINGGLNSPARRLQNFLDGEVHRDDQPAERWSTRRTVLFVTATCGAFWATVFIASSLLIG